MKMLFLYRGLNSGTNHALLQAWKSEMPDIQITTCDADSYIFKGLLPKLRAIPQAIKKAGPLVFLKKAGNFKNTLTHSEWHIKKLQKIAEQLQKKERPDFSFGFSAFPSFIKPDQPHFIYTDLPILGNQYYPDGNKQIERWKECIPYEKQAYNQASMVFTMSEHSRQSLIEHYGLPEEKTLCVQAGCNIPYIENNDPKRYQRKKILFVGVDWERKGGPELVEAFSRIRKKHPTATLTVVGCNPKLTVPGETIEGFHSQEQTAKFLADSSIFAMPSRREAFGMVYLEAMRAGLPVLASDLGSTPDFIINGKNGFRINQGDIDELSLRLDELLSNHEQCRNMGIEAQKIVEQNYTWKLTQQKMWNAIKNFIK